MLWNYFTIGWMGIATITQLLSMLGIAAEINLMVWMYGGVVNMVVSFISGLVAIYAYDAYWQVAEDSTSPSWANAADAALALAAFETDIYHAIV